MTENARPRRVTLTESEAESKAGSKLIEAFEILLADGKFTEKEITSLQHWLGRACAVSDVPGIHFLKDEVDQVLADGKVTEAEMWYLVDCALRVLPSIERARLKVTVTEAKAKAKADAKEQKRLRQAEEATKPTEKQLAFITNLGGKLPYGATRQQASELIDQLLASRPSSQPIPYPIAQWQIDLLKRIGIPFSPMISGSDSKTLIENSKIDPRYAAVWAEIHAQQQIEARELEQEEMQELQQKYGKAFTLEVTKWKKIDEDNEGIQYLMIYRKGNDLPCDIVEYVHYEIVDGKNPDIAIEAGFPTITECYDGNYDIEWDEYKTIKASKILHFQRLNKALDISAYREYQRLLTIGKQHAEKLKATEDER